MGDINQLIPGGSHPQGTQLLSAALVVPVRLCKEPLGPTRTSREMACNTKAPVVVQAPKKKF